MSIFVPPHVQRKLATENLVKAVLGVVEKAGPKGYPVAALRAGFRRLGVEPRLAEYVENRLVREKIITLEANRLRIGTAEDIRAFLARSKWDESRIVAITPEERPS